LFQQALLRNSLHGDISSLKQNFQKFLHRVTHIRSTLQTEFFEWSKNWLLGSLYPGKQFVSTEHSELEGCPPFRKLAALQLFDLLIDSAPESMSNLLITQETV